MPRNRRKPMTSCATDTAPGSHFDVGPGLEFSSDSIKGEWIRLIEEFNGSVGEDNSEPERGVRWVTFEYLDSPVGPVLAKQNR